MNRMLWCKNVSVILFLLTEIRHRLVHESDVVDVGRSCVGCRVDNERSKQVRQCRRYIVVDVRDRLSMFVVGGAYCSWRLGCEVAMVILVGCERAAGDVEKRVQCIVLKYYLTIDVVKSKRCNSNNEECLLNGKMNGTVCRVKIFGVFDRLFVVVVVVRIAPSSSLVFGGRCIDLDVLRAFLFCWCYYYCAFCCR